MKLIKKTKTGKYFRLNDNRIGSIYDSGYVRITTKNNDREYQINKVVKIYEECKHSLPFYHRLLIENECDRMSHLKKYEENNC